MTITSDQVKDLRGTQVLDRNDEKVGKIGEVYVDNADGEPRWITVNTGMMGRESFVPLDGARTGDGAVRVATDKKTIKDAPHTGENSGELSESEERRLYSHYGMTDGTGRGAEGREADTRNARGTKDESARDRSDRHDRGDQGMTRSEERLQVGTESHETGRVRLRKYVVTENQSVEVPVSHEEVRLEREPIDAPRKARGAIGEDEQSMTLHAERPVVGKEAYEVENVRLDSRTVTEHETVSDEVRKEQIDVEDPAGALSGDRRK